MSLTAAELTYMRDTQELFLPDLCTVRRLTAVPDGYGGTTYTNVDTANVVCRAWNTQTKEQPDLAGAERNLYPWMFTFKHNQDVILKDRILYQGFVIEVKDINTPDSWTTAKRVGGENVD